MRFLRWLAWWRPPFVVRSVILNLKSSDVIEGVLWQVRGPWFTVTKAALLKAGQPPTPMDGEAVVHRNEISFVQVLP